MLPHHFQHEHWMVRMYIDLLDLLIKMVCLGYWCKKCWIHDHLVKWHLSWRHHLLIHKYLVVQVHNTLNRCVFFFCILGIFFSFKKFNKYSLSIFALLYRFLNYNNTLNFAKQQTLTTDGVSQLNVSAYINPWKKRRDKNVWNECALW